MHRLPGSLLGEVQVEGTVPVGIVDALRAKGHNVVKPAKPIGGSQAIWIDREEGVLTGGSDPAKTAVQLVISKGPFV